MKKKVLKIIFLYLLISYQFCFGLSVFKIDTLVNEEVITNYDISQRINLLELLQNKKQNVNDVRSELIIETLVKQYTEKINLFVENNEYQKFKLDTLNSFGINNEELIKILERKDVSYDNFKKFLIYKILWNNLIKYMFVKDTKLTNNDINKPIYRNYKKEKINLSEIVIPYKERGKENSIKLATRLYKEIESSENFELAARRFSRAKSSQKNGLIGNLEIKSLPVEIQESLKNKKINQVTEPIILEDKVLILRINEVFKTEIINEKNYEVKYILTKNLPKDISRICNLDLNSKIKIKKLSNLKNDLEKTLTQLNNYQTIKVSNNPLEYLTLCDRRILLNSPKLNEFKNQIFNEKIKVQSDIFLNQLLRSSSIKINE